MSLGFVENEYGLEWNDEKLTRLLKIFKIKKSNMVLRSFEKFAKDTFSLY